MSLSRLDLDGTASPLGLVTYILKAEPSLKIPVPIEDIAIALDIAEINEIETHGFIGGLVTDEERSSGGILVKKGIDVQRRRFTIAHELGHFLMPYHRPVETGQFVCDRDAMRAWDAKTKNSYLKMEAQANQFAAALLMPPPHVRTFLGAYREPDFQAALDLHQEFDVSKIAAARCYVEHYGDCLAVIVAKSGKFLYAYRHRDFPWLSLSGGSPIPSESRYHTHSGSGLSPLMSVGAEHWIETEYGKRVPHMKEQILHQGHGYSLILLWLDADDEDYDPEEDMTSKQRFSFRQDQNNRY